MSGSPRVGLLFPGQGSQFVGMGEDLSREFPEAARTFEEADDVLGFSLSDLCWRGPEEELTRTVNAQPAILTHSIAAWRVVRRRAPEALVAAGHSLGEFSAYVAAGALDFPDALRTVRRRGELMFQSGGERPGTMAAVLGLDDAVVDAVCSEASAGTAGVVVAANFNAPGQVVISGDVAAVRAAEAGLKAAGARRVLPLNVSGAFHSPLMAVAEAGLEEALAGVEMRDPDFPVVSNVTALPVARADAARPLLVQQLTSAVRWVASVQAMRTLGVEEFRELGPGSVLTGLLKRIDRDSIGRPLGSAEELNRFPGEG